MKKQSISQISEQIAAPLTAIASPQRIAILLLIGIPIVVVELVVISVFGGIIETALASFGEFGEVVSFVARFVSGLVFLALLGVIVSAITLVYIILTGDETLKAHLPAPLATFVEPL